MFIDFGSSKCPACGTSGKVSDEEHLLSCPNCSTSFSNYAIVASFEKEKDLELN